jgi:hypothetical protein
MRPVNITMSNCTVRVGFSLILALSVLKSYGTTNKADKSVVDEFKTFVSSPPPIRTFKYSKSWLDLGRQTVLRDEKVPLLEAEFQGKWQPRSLILKWGTQLNPDTLKQYPGEALLAYSETSYWMLTPQRRATHWQETINRIDDIHFAHSIYFRQIAKEVDELLNMGIMHAPAGTVRWDGNKLSGRGYIPESRTTVTVEGILHTRDDRPESIEVKYVSGIGVWDYRIRYSYETNIGLACLPSRIESFFSGSNQFSKLAEWNLSQIDPAEGRLPESSFRIHKAITEAGGKIQIFTNGNWHMSNALGQLVPVRNVINPVTVASKRTEPMLYYGLVTALGVCAFVLIRGRNQQQSKHIQERNI